MICCCWGGRYDCQFSGAFACTSQEQVALIQIFGFVLLGQPNELRPVMFIELAERKRLLLGGQLGSALFSVNKFVKVGDIGRFRRGAG